MTRYLVTSALPYANGPIHFGHVAGAYLPADVYVRYLKMAKGPENVLYVCGTDEHGVAITLKAEQAGVGYREYVDRWHGEIRSLFDRFDIQFDTFSGTSRCAYHAETSRKFFSVLLEREFVFAKTEKQWFSEQSQRFLPDRYLQGGCPQCGFEKARGDECPDCGSWIDARELKTPISLIDGSSPVLKPTKHWYLDLPKLQEAGLDSWYRGTDENHPVHAWKPNVDGHVQAMLRDLHERPITRDLPWGVELPEGLEDSAGKVLYVWFDAPIGYISATMEWAAANGTPDAWKDWWQNEDTRLVHFIGKDNIAFHVVVFPSMLLGQENAWDGKPFVMPWAVPANEFYNLQGRKFNTSSGWYLDNDSFFAQYNACAARFHVLMSAPETADSEFTWTEFQVTNNNLLADKVGNLASRVLKFLDKRFDSCVPEVANAPSESILAVRHHASLAEADTAFGAIGDFIENHEFRKAAQHLIAACSALNQFFDAMEPWKKVKGKDDGDLESCAETMERCIAYLELLSRRIAPFCPTTAGKLRAMLGTVAETQTATTWGVESATQAPATLAAGLKIGVVEVLFGKIDDQQIADEIAKLEASASVS